MEVSTQSLLPLRSSGSPPALRTWCLLQRLAFEIETAGNIVLQQRVRFLHSSRNHLWRARVPSKVHISWSTEPHGLQVPKMKWPLGVQTKGYPFKAFRASLRAPRGVCLWVFLQMEGLQDKCHATLTPVAGDAGQRLGTSYLGGSSAPYKMQPRKDKVNLHQQRTKKNR